MLQGGKPFSLASLPFSSPLVPSVVRLSTEREEEVVLRSSSKGLKELLGEDE